LNHHLKYLGYLLKHKWFVLVASVKIGAPIWQAIIHDLSKFRPSAWNAYAQFFYWSKETKNEETMRAFPMFGCCEAAPYGYFVDDRFNIAWNHHQKRNKHHWQYWLLTQDTGETWVMPMPRRYVLEMVADWMGAGRAITGRWEAREWYLANRHKMKFGHETRAIVHEILNIQEPE
jgi:hypothetical protein